MNAITNEQILSHPDLRDLVKHIDETSVGLIGSQWVVIEILPSALLPEGFGVKAIGYSREDQMISGTFDYFRSRQYCGITYHMEAWTREPEVVQNLRGLSEKHGTEFAFFNAYQNKLRRV